MTDDQEILRAARELVRNPAWRHVLVELKTLSYQEFESAQVGDDDARRSAWHQLDSVNRIASMVNALSEKLDKSL